MELIFSEDFFKTEEREGFLIEETMKRAWAAQLEVLSLVDRICQRHGIKYYADSGTLLGAVRHGGYIPWDDDLDIHMLRSDYNKFIRKAIKDLPKSFVVLNVYNTTGFADMLTRISNLPAPDFSDTTMERFHGFPYPCGIDITPVDYIPKDPDELLVFNSLIEMCLVLANIFEKGTDTDQERENALVQVEQCTGMNVDRSRDIPQQLRIIADRICGMYQPHEAEVVGYAIRQKDRPLYNWPRDIYSDRVMLPFEMAQIPAAAGYEKELISQYGEDYMTPKQVFGHDYPFYKKWM